jgi:glutathione synthase/RimK-type ligase-like ATP-grasp enzyme
MPHGLPAEDPLLVAALARRGVTAAIMPWGNPDAADAELVVVRTTWDYTDHVTEFLAWLRQVASATTVLNPVPTIEWNSHKRYLLDLAAAGVPVVPTALVPQWASGQAVGDALGEHGGEVVVKPAVSVGAIGALRGAAASAEVTAHLLSLVAVGDALVQPYQPSITGGEVSLIYFDREFSHAVRKTPATGDYRVQVFHGGVNDQHRPSGDEVSVAAAALASVDGDLAYARVDLVDTARGPALMEVELIEPQLFLDEPSSAAEMFAERLAWRLSQR